MATLEGTFSSAEVVLDAAVGMLIWFATGDAAGGTSVGGTSWFVLAAALT